MGKIKQFKLRSLIKGRPYLAWYVKDFKKLSVESIVETVLNYGQWQDVQKLMKILGICETRDVFDRVVSKKRSNIRPQTENYFKEYFARYAS